MCFSVSRMTETEFLAAWATASADQRYENFRNWVGPATDPGAPSLEINELDTLSATNPVLFNTLSRDGRHLQLEVWSGMFALDSSALAHRVGREIIDVDNHAGALLDRDATESAESEVPEDEGEDEEPEDAQAEEGGDDAPFPAGNSDNDEEDRLMALIDELIARWRQEEAGLED